MSRVRYIFLAAGLLSLALMSPSLACKGATEIYSDDFQSRDAGWFVQQADLQSGKVTVGDGRVLVKEGGQRGYSILNFAFALPADTDICVKARILQSADLAKASVGVLFWAKGYDDNYVFQATGDGKYFVAHFFNRAWEVITPAATSDTFKSGLGEDNLLRVMTKGQTVTLFVNDSQVAKFRAPVPAGLVKAGFRAGAIGSDPVAVEFRDFKVTTPP